MLEHVYLFCILLNHLSFLLDCAIILCGSLLPLAAFFFEEELLFFEPINLLGVFLAVGDGLCQFLLQYKHALSIIGVLLKGLIGTGLGEYPFLALSGHLGVCDLPFVF